MLKRATLAFAWLLIGLLLARTRALAAPTVSAPGGVGDQVIFYYDARDAFTTFINVHNGGASDLTVRVLAYGPTFANPFVETTHLPGGGLVVLDVGAWRGAGLPAQNGVVIATAVDVSGASIVTRALSGNFTVANLATNAAWGASGAARTAVRATSSKAPLLGDVIDGTKVVLPAIQPTNADLATYYDPQTLAPVAQSGNELIFLAFEDVPGSGYAATSARVTWSVAGVRNSGATLGLTRFVASGVTVSDLESVIGGRVNGASGGVFFRAAPDPAPITRLIFFAESLGTFGMGYVLPGGLAPSSPGSFLVTSCGLSHSLPDDPILFPGNPGASHLHDFFANDSTSAASTYGSMVSASSNCDPNTGDLAGYWVPALLRDGKKVDPVGQGDRSFRAYYQVVDAVGIPVEAFPADLRMVAGHSHATTPTENPLLGKEIYWGCSDNSTGKLLEPPPSCATGIISVHVGFPSCWDGVLTHVDDSAHVAYPTRDGCPAGFPRHLPRLILRIEYPVGTDSGSVMLSSGPPASLHADFWNTWDQARLATLIDDCTNAGVDCGKM